MASSEAGSEGSPVLTVAQSYEQMCSDIRFTDDISLKLLGLIPLVSGAGILTVLFAGPDRSRWEAALLGGFVGLFGAIVTFAVYRWERRNSLFCEFRRDQVALLEAHVPLLSQHGLELKRPDAPVVCFGWRRKKKGETKGETKKGEKKKGDTKEGDTKEGDTKEGGTQVQRVCFGWQAKIGKTQAERILYTAVIMSWLALPGIAALLA